MKKLLIFGIATTCTMICTALFFGCADSLDKNIPADFSTGGDPVYHLKTGNLVHGSKAVITASLNGEVKCFTPDGTLIWKAETEGGFPFDLCVADIDNDDFDEVLVASGNGKLFTFDNDGKSLWTFSNVPPLYQVSVVINANGDATIITGGVEQVLYKLSPKGEVLGELKTEHCIRHIRTGGILEKDEDFIAMATASTGLFGNLKLFLIDPENLEIVWMKDKLGRSLNNTGRRFFSMLVKDVTNDGLDEILLSGGWGENGIVYAFDQQGEILFSKSDEKIPNIAYRMNLLKSVELPEDNFFLGHFGNVLIVYELDGTCREVVWGKYSFADSYFDKDLRTLFMGSSVSGGDGVYAFSLDKPGWQQKFREVNPIGRLAEIESNLAVLTKQIGEFIPPDYQPEPRRTIVISPNPLNIDYQNISFNEAITLSQKIENRDELWCKSMDQRRLYNLSADEIVNLIKVKEAAGKDFVIWAGHGSAMHFPLSTFERIIRAAPKHLQGFIFAEMTSVNEHMQEVVTKIILPLAELCKQNNKVIILRNKNIFWNGACYLPFWKKILFNEQYGGVFIPGLEETNSRTQELSLAGRIGLWQMGYFDHWLGRVTTDNVNSDRMFEWGGQQVINHHLRNLVSSASQGADVFYNTLDITDLSFETQKDTSVLYKQLVPFYEMIDKGIIHIPERTELLSVSDVALGMTDSPSNAFITNGTDGHKYAYPTDVQKEMVFGHLNPYWSCSSLDSFDYSFFAFNVRLRMTNFIPETPYGMTVIIPAETKTGGRFRKIIATDGEYFFDEQGKQYTASEYKPVIQSALAEGAQRLPVLVRGKVHWSVVKLDEKHLRITLIDPGYLDPARRDAEIVLQNVSGISCTDILSKESLPIKEGKIALTVPAGVFRIVDVEISE
jgi:lambda-carrageenase